MNLWPLAAYVRDLGAKARKAYWCEQTEDGIIHRSLISPMSIAAGKGSLTGY